MTFRERIINWFTKRRKRYNFYAGSSTSRILNNFVTSGKTADSEIRQTIKVLRHRARDLAKNNAYARRFINAYVDNVVGPRGMHLQVRSRDPNGALDTFANSLIEMRWKDFTKKGNCTADGKLSFLEVQRLFAEIYARDGEVLVRTIYNFDNPSKYALEFIESDRLDHEYNENLSNGNIIRMGVEINKFGKPINYYILKVHPDDNFHSPATYTKDKYNKVPAEEMIHFYHQERPNQTRGVPLLSSCLKQLKMLDGYMEAELVAARVGASKMGFFKSGDGTAYTGEDKTDTNNPIMSAEPGTFEQLPTGVDFQQFDPQHPTTAFKDFTKSVIRAIASSLNISYNTLANDLESVNYSSLRQGALEERSHYQCEQHRMIDGFMNIIYAKWLNMAFLAGNLSNLPDGKYNKFNSPIWRPRGWQWIDPKKEVDALQIGMSNGFLSMQDVQAGYGRDVEDVFASIQTEKELAQKYGIQIAFEPFGDKGIQQVNQKVEDEE